MLFGLERPGSAGVAFAGAVVALALGVVLFFVAVLGASMGGEGAPVRGGHARVHLREEEAEHALADDTLSVLCEYDWPGNVRELENALERAVVVSGAASIGPDSLPTRVREAPAPRLGAAELPPNPTMEVVERAYILWVLESEGGNKTRAAEVLGIDPSTLYRKLNRYGIDAS